MCSNNCNEILRENADHDGTPFKTLLVHLSTTITQVVEKLK